MFQTQQQIASRIFARRGFDIKGRPLIAPLTYATIQSRLEVVRLLLKMEVQEVVNQQLKILAVIIITRFNHYEKIMLVYEKKDGLLTSGCRWPYQRWRVHQ